MLTRRIRHHRVGHGFTLVELLACIAVIAVLIGLLVSILGGMRRTSRDHKCLIAMRECGTLISAYAVDYRDRLPYAGDSRHEVTVPGDGRMIIGGSTGFSGGLWAVAFQDRWTGRSWDRALQCPAQPLFTDWSDPPTRGGNGLPFFSLTSAAWLRADQLSLSVPYDQATPRQNALSQVDFPSKKVMFFEQVGFCASGPDASWWIYTIGQTFAYKTSTLTFDGSAIRMRQIDGLAAAHTMPFVRTIGGLHGRDLP